jgi:hypothetical protein
VPVIRILDPNLSEPTVKKYAMTEDITPTAIKDFVNEYIEGNLKQSLKVQQDPTSPASHHLPV